jgi:predicted nucleic acid-binding protein
MNLVDTSGWIEYFFEGPNAHYFSKPIEDTKHLIVPVICLYEVFKKVNTVANEAKALQAIAQMKQGHIIDLIEDIALRASLVSLKHKLSMADSFIYATAQIRNALLWTQDEHFRSLPNVNYKETRTKKATRRSKPLR